MKIFAWSQNPAVMESLGWTMVHFLWLGSLVCLVAGCGRRLLRGASPGVRYWYSVLCMIGLTIMPIVLMGTIKVDSTPSTALEARQAPGGQLPREFPAVESETVGAPRGGISVSNVTVHDGNISSIGKRSFVACHTGGWAVFSSARHF